MLLKKKRNLKRRRGDQEKCTFSAEWHPLLLFMLIFFMEMSVMLSFSPLAVEQLEVGRKHGLWIGKVGGQCGGQGTV